MCYLADIFRRKETRLLLENIDFVSQMRSMFLLYEYLYMNLLEEKNR